MGYLMRFLPLAIVVVVFGLVGRCEAQTFNVGANFQTTQGGSGAGSESGFTPPDTQGAAGQNHIMILNNGRYKSFSKVGTQLQSKSDATFFTDAAYSGPSAAGDPRVQFDPLSGRWFAAEFTGGSGNRIIIAVSENANPTGNWKSVFIQNNISGQFADFPTMAIDANGIYIGTNNFNGTFTVSLHTAAKSGLLWTGAGTPTLTNLTQFEGMSNGSPSNRGSTLQATNNFDPNQSGNTNRVVANFNSTNRVTYNIQNTGGTTTLSTSGFIAVNTQNSPPNVGQSGSGTMIQTNDNRIGGQSVQVGNFIYFANAFDNGTGRSQARFTVLNATTGAVVQQGNINDPSLAYFFPTIAVNGDGQAVLGFSGSSSTTFVGSYAAVGTVNSSTGMITFGSPSLVSAGLGNYAGFDGSPYRWGDYSAVTVDPADTGIFWSFQERATASPGLWATQATEIIPTVTGAGGADQVRWRNAADGAYTSPANWFTAVPDANDHVIYSRNGAAYTVTLPAGLTQNDRISVRQGTTTFSIAGGATYQATNTSASTPSFAVSQHLGDTTLTISGGGTLSTVYTTLAAGENGLTTNNISRATVNVSGALTTWTNSRDMYFGGSATRSGGQAQLNINSGATVTVGEVARFWTSNSGVAINGITANFNVGGLRADSGVNPLITGTSANANLNITDGMAQTYFGRIEGTTNIVKSGAGTQTLSGSMNYTGLTTINAGRLNINGVKSGAGAVSVSNGTLGGSGSVAGLTTVLANGNISPGASAGNLTFTGGVTMNAGDYDWELAALSVANPGTDYDVMTLNGGVSTLGGTSEVELFFLGATSPNLGAAFWNSSHQWLIVDLVGGTLTGNFFAINNPNYSTGSFFLSGGNGDVFLNFSPVPEPSSIALVCMGLGGFALARRIRRKAK